MNYFYPEKNDKVRRDHQHHYLETSPNLMARVIHTPDQMRHYILNSHKE